MQFKKVAVSLRDIPRGETTVPKLPTVKRPWGRVISVPRKDDRKNIGLRIVFPLDIERHDYRKSIIADFLDSTLSGGLSSRLLNTLRTKLGFVYKISMDSNIDYIVPGNGYVLIETECDASKIVRVVKTICSICRALAKQGPTKTELEKWRNDVQTSRADNLLDSDPTRFVQAYSPYLTFSDKYPTLDKIDKISLSITRPEVKDLAQEIFLEKCMVFHTGPESLNKEIEKSAAPCLIKSTKRKRKRTSRKRR